MQDGRVNRMASCAWAVVACVSAAMLGGCGLFGDKEPTKQDPALVGTSKKPVPAFAEIARAYNQRIQYQDQLFARVNLKLTYADEEGNLKTEEPEGRLQIIRPAKLALSLGKAGQTLLWFGCDPEKYWWLDMTDNAKRIGAVGRHEDFDDSAAERIGLAIKPLDMIRLLGIVPIEVMSKGATQWSQDGRLLGVTSAIGARGYQRIWMDPRTLQPETIEIFNQSRELVLVAQHEGLENIEITRSLPGAQLTNPRIAARIFITHLESGTEARMTLTGVKDGPISEKAFQLPVLLDRFAIDRVIDLDARGKKARPASSAAGGSGSGQGSK